MTAGQRLLERTRFRPDNDKSPLDAGIP